MAARCREQLGLSLFSEETTRLNFNHVDAQFLTCLRLCIVFCLNRPHSQSCMQEVAATRQQPRWWRGGLRACIQWMRCVQTIIPTLIVHPVEIDSKVVVFFFLSFFALSAPGLAVRTGRENVIHNAAAVSIICTAAVQGIKESTAAAWLREHVRVQTVNYREMDVWRP